MLGPRSYMSMGELSPLLTCHVVAWAEERCICVHSPAPHHPHTTPVHQLLSQEGELSLPLISCLWIVASRPCLGNTVELALKVWEYSEDV